MALRRLSDNLEFPSPIGGCVAITGSVFSVISTEGRNPKNPLLAESRFLGFRLEMTLAHSLLRERKLLDRVQGRFPAQACDFPFRKKERRLEHEQTEEEGGVDE